MDDKPYAHPKQKMEKIKRLGLVVKSQQEARQDLQTRKSSSTQSDCWLA
jgi:hypothetical protein